MPCTQQEMQLQGQPKDKDMLQEAKEHQELLQQLRRNLDEDLVLYLDLTDRCYKRVGEPSRMSACAKPHTNMRQFDIGKMYCTQYCSGPA